MARFLWRLIDGVETALLLIASLGLFALMALTFIDVSMRSVLNASVQPATELTRILMALVVFASLPSLMGRGEAIIVDLLDPLARRLRLARLQQGLVDLFCGIVLFWPAKRLWVLVERARDHGEVTEFLQIPQYLVLGAIASVVAITGVVTIARGALTLFFPRLAKE